MSELRRWARVSAGAAFAVAAVAAVALASRLPVGTDPGHAELRLALRTAAARLEVCRERSDEELERLPAHFRVRRECDEIPVDYRLTVAVDGRTLLDRAVSHRGVRRTRPLAVDEALAVQPGRRRVEIAFVPVPPSRLAVAASEDEREPDEDAEDDEHDEHGEEATRGEREIAEAFAALAAPRLAAEIEFRPGRAELFVLGEGGVLERGGAR